MDVIKQENILKYVGGGLEELETNLNDGGSVESGSWMRKLENSVFDLVARLTQEQVTMTKLWRNIVLVQLIGALQLVALVFSKENGLKWSPFVLENVSPWLQATELRFQSQNVNNAVFLVLFTLAVVTINMLVYFARFSGSNWNIQPWFLCMWFLTSVLYIPCLRAYLGVFTCSVSVFGCGDSVHAVSQVFMGAFLVVFVSICVCFDLLLARRVGASGLKDLDTRPHGRITSCGLLVKACLCVLMESFRRNEIGSVFIVVSSAMALCYLTMWYLPYNYIERNKIELSGHLIFFWASLCLTGQYILFSTDPKGVGQYGLFITFCCGIPLAYTVSSIVIDRRIDYLVTRKTGSTVEDPLIVELVIRLTLIAKGDEEDAKNLDELWDLLKHLVDEKFPRNGFLLFHFCRLLEMYGGNQFLVMQYFRKGRERELLFDDRFVLYLHRLENEKSEEGKGDSQLNYMLMERYNAEATKLTLECLQIIKKVWRMLRHSIQDEDLLIKNAIQLRNQSTKASEALELYLKYSNFSLEAMNLYSIFLDDVLNDHYLAVILKRKMDDIRREKGIKDESTSSQALLTICGNEIDLGKIVDATNAVSSLLGYPKETLFGKTLDSLCPPPFDEISQIPLETYLGNTNIDFSPTIQNIWLRHRRGYTIAIELEVRPMLDEFGELLFMAKMVEDTTRSKSFVGVDKGDKKIYFASESGWSNVLEMDVQPIRNKTKTLSFTEFFENEETEDPSFQRLFDGTNDGKEVLITKNNVKLHVKPSTQRTRGKKNQDESLDVVLLEFMVDDDMASPLTFTNGLDGLAQGGLNGSFKSATSGGGKSSVRLEKKRSAMDDRSSVGSGSVFSRGSSHYNSVFHMVKRGLMENEKRAMTYKKIILISVGICMLLALAEWFNRTRMYEEGLVAVEQIQSVVMRSFVMIDAVISIQTLKHANGSSIFSTELEQNLKGDAEALHILHLANMKHIGEKSKAFLEHTYARDLEVLYSFDDDNYLNTTGLVSFWVSILEFKNSLEQMTRNISFPFACNSHCRFIVNNGPVPCFTASVDAVRLNADHAIEVLHDLEMFEIVNLSAVSLFALLVILLYIMPTVLQNWKRQQNTFESIFSIPKDMTKNLSTVAAFKHSQFQAKHNAAPEGDDNDDQTRKTLAKERQSGRIIDTNTTTTTAAISQTATTTDKLVLSGKPLEGSTSNHGSESITNDKLGASLMREESNQGLYRSLKKVTPLLDDNIKILNQSEETIKLTKQRSLKEDNGSERPLESVAAVPMGNLKHGKNSENVPARPLDKVEILSTLMHNSKWKKKQNHFVIRWIWAFFYALFKLGVPFLLTVVYFASLTLVEEVYLQQRIDLASTIQSAGMLLLFTHNSFYFLLSDYENMEPWDRFGNRENEKLAFLDDIIQNVNVYRQDLVYSMDSSTSSREYDLNFGNACFSSCNRYPELPFSIAMRTGGLQNGLKSYFTFVDAKKEELYNGTTFPHSLTMREKLDEIHEVYILVEALQESVQLYLDQYEELIHVQESMGRIALLVFILMLLYSGFVTYRLFLRFDKEMSNIQFLLLLIPKNVIQDHAPLQKLFEKL